MAKSISKLASALASFLDPRAWLHGFRILHYYGYSHVRPRSRISFAGKNSIAPNVSFRNGERISIGKECFLGERCFLWGGDSSGRIRMGNHVSLAPGVFITASDYQFEAGRPFKEQPRRERDVIIGNDVWLGAYVVVTAGVTIGDGCIVGAGAVVTKDLPPDSIAVGVPARVVGRRESVPPSPDSPPGAATPLSPADARKS